MVELMREAESILKRAGYRILSRQIKETIITVINGREHFGYVEADFLVTKHKKKFVVMVRAGAETVEAQEPSLRRRLLEHQRAFPSYGLLVLDLNNDELHEVSFRFPHEWNLDFLFRFLAALFILGVVIGIIWILATIKLY